jgi:Short-chain dehydrogenases of various substrate specificities
MLLRGRNIVITGSGRGIGKTVAIACAKEGANVGLTSRTLEELNNTKKEIEKNNYRYFLKSLIQYHPFLLYRR